MMSRKHYREAADAVHRFGDLEVPFTDPRMVHAYLTGALESLMVDFFKYDNPNFDEERFRAWCQNGTDKKS